MLFFTKNKIYLLAFFLFISKSVLADMPGFENYPIKEIYTGENHKLVDADDDSNWQEYRKQAVKHPINFAGHYIAYTQGCGGGAICGEIIDAKTGKIVATYPNAYLVEDDDGKNYFDNCYKKNSSLIIISGIAADIEKDKNNNILQPTYKTRYYNFVGNEFILLNIDDKPFNCKK